MPTIDDPEVQAAGALARARCVGVLTGAGISAESGIPTFRQSMEGLWATFDPETLATPAAFARDPALVSRWYDERRRGCLAAVPNAGHRALARLERELDARSGSLTILTQNVDGLHQRAGSQRVVELHGSITVWRCTRTGAEYRDLEQPLREYPRRSDAGGLLRPGVVWFGEALPPEALAAADRLATTCDTFLSIGTSAAVYPAAGFVSLASAHGATTIEVNRDPTPLSTAVTWSIRGCAGEVLPRLVERAFGAEVPSSGTRSSHGT